VKILKRWSDNDTTDMALFDDGTLFMFGEKAAAHVGLDGTLLGQWWRTDPATEHVQLMEAGMMEAGMQGDRIQPLTDEMERLVSNIGHFNPDDTRNLRARAILLAIIKETD
jgi:hypothetical protein